MTAKLCVLIAALTLALAVVTGAFGAHALRERMPDDLLTVWQTAVHYHFYHALGLLGVGVLMTQWGDTAALRTAAWLLVAGLLLFSGTLYLLAATGARQLGAVTPLGGAAFIAAWLAVGWAAWSR